MPAREELPILVSNPRRLPGWTLPAQRIALGKGYKPSMALLPDGSLVILTLYMKQGRPADGNMPPSHWWQLDESLPAGKCHEYNRLWRSTDGGKTWTDGDEVADMIGREQWLTCTSKGTLFATSHLLSFDVANQEGYTNSWLHRSIDGGETWTGTRLSIDGDMREGMPVEAGANASRNVVELDDGTLLLGVSINDSNVACMWKSTDNGETWDKTQRSKINGYYRNLDGFYAEDFTYLDDSGVLLHWCRVGHPSPMTSMADGRVVPSGSDQCDRMMWTQSTDLGVTWSQVTDFFDYGQMYPRVLKLADGRLLMTYTQRGLKTPFGLRAIVSCDDGETWDLDSDELIIDGFTAWGYASGGGFGNTVQLPDATLVSCYSYDPKGDSQYQFDVVRWNLP